MYSSLFIIYAFNFACDSSNKTAFDTAELETESSSCPNSTYPGFLKVWNSVEGDNLVDTPPFCETPFYIELREDEILYSAGECQFQGGQQIRTLSYIFQGGLDESGGYSGEVSLLRQNGIEDFAVFSGSCTPTESSVEIDIYWNMTVTTPNGERLHSGILSTEE